MVAYGVVFGDGHVALRWTSSYPATSLWNSLDDLMAVHGHGHATSIEWLDPATDPFGRTDGARLAESESTPRPEPARRLEPEPARRPEPEPAPEPPTPAAPQPIRDLVREPAATPPAGQTDSPPRTRVTGRRARRVAVDSPAVLNAPAASDSQASDAPAALDAAGAPAVPPPPPADPAGGRPPHSRVPSQRRAGRHRRASAEPGSHTSTQPIERDGP